ncbi:CC115 protein, partial [Amia calva]|nr:CC115 protein [Amia calva]
MLINCLSSQYAAGRSLRVEVYSAGPGMGVSVTELSLRLDELTMQFMDQLESLEQKRERFNSLIEQGWFSISKARYAMGNKCVSALQYGNEMEPLVHINTRASEGGGVEFCTERLEPRSTEASKEDLSTVEEIGPKEEGIRRRKTAKPKDPREDAVVSEEVPKDEQTAGQIGGPLRSPDPLKWFGILVPQSLKQAQSTFKQVIELSAEIAVLQTQVTATREQLRRRRLEKQQLLQGKEQ